MGKESFILSKIPGICRINKKNYEFLSPCFDKFLKGKGV